jgi:hypothetical protein
MRSLLIGVLAAGLLLAGVLLALVTPRSCPVTRTRCARIETGMTRAQVDAILGVPPGDYRTHPGLSVSVASGGWSMVSGSIESWTGNEGELAVCFHGGVVVMSDFTPVEPVKIGPIELVRWRLERLKEHLRP